MPESSLKSKKNSDSVVEKGVFRLAWPIFLQFLLAVSLGNIDTIMLSNYNNTAVGAIGNANSVLGFLTLAFTIISSATGIVVSQYLGAGKKDRMNIIYTVALSFNIVLSVVISAVVFLFSENLLAIMQVPKEMLPEADAYMKIVGGTIFTQALISALSQIFNSNGKTLFGMIISLGMNVFNIAGNYLFLYGPLKVFGLGAAGAAVSTCASRVLTVIIAFVYFYVVIKGRFSLRYLKPFPLDVLKSLLKLGIPTAGENISYNFSQLIITAFVNTMGIVAINTKIYANLLSMFTYMIAMSAATATQIIVGHAVGSGDYDYAYKKVLKTLRFGLIVSMTAAVANWLLAPLTFSIFTKDRNVIELGSAIMLIAAILELGRTTNLVVISSMKASGDVKFPTILAIFSMWGLSVGLAYLLGIVFGMGLAGVWIGMAADEILRGIIVLIRWLKGSWRGKKVVVEN